jgi:hypothetical protein
MDAFRYGNSRHLDQLRAVAPRWHRAGSEVTVLTWVGQNDALRIDARGARAMEEPAERCRLIQDLARLAGNAECYADTVLRLAGPGRALHVKFVDHPLGIRHGVYGVGKRAIEHSFQSTGLVFVENHLDIMQDPAVWVDDLHLRQVARTHIGSLLAAVVTGAPSGGSVRLAAQAGHAAAAPPAAAREQEAGHAAAAPPGDALEQAQLEQLRQLAHEDAAGTAAAAATPVPPSSPASGVQNRFFIMAARSMAEVGMADVCAGAECTEPVTGQDAKGFCGNCWRKWNASRSVDAATVTKKTWAARCDCRPPEGCVGHCDGGASVRACRAG